MKDNSTWDRFKLFLKNIPSTLKESLIWFIMTYLMPLIQILIIWGIGDNSSPWSLTTLNIILVTNASLFTAILVIAGTVKKDRRLFSTITIALYVLTVVLFAFSMLEINQEITILKNDLYEWGSLFSFILALLLGLICKYDEVKAQSIDLANKGKSRTDAKINNEIFQL